MKKLLFLLLLLPAMLLAAPVDPNLAQQIAENFINASESDANSAMRKAPRKPKHMVRVTKQVTKAQQFYVFNSEDSEGFVIVSGDDNARPVLAYSLTSSLDVNNLPYNLKQWFDEYNNQIVWARQNGAFYRNVKSEWDNIRSNNVDYGIVKVGPLLSTEWDQNRYYNTKCPTTWMGVLGDNGHVYAGCTACAMAQTMKFWNYPARGQGSFTNTNNPTYGDLYANFGNTTYDWQNMPNKLTSTSTTTQVNAVATLLYHCGVALNTDYGYQGSGADPSIVPLAANMYFKYSNLIYNISRSDHTDFSWYMVITRQLDQHRPVMYGGYPVSTQQAGHSFVCDGYTNKMYFHFNWGWSGAGNGYFLLDALLPDPSIDGSGAGSYDYRFRQNAVVNFVPDGMFAMDSIQLFHDLVIPKDTINSGENFSVTATIGSYAETTYKGNIYAAVLDENSNVVMLLDSLVNETIKTGEFLQIQFESPSVTLAEGRYYIGLVWKVGNQVGVVGGDFYSNIIPFYIHESPFKIKPGKYVIVASRNKTGDKNWYYMTSDLGTASTKRFQAVSTGTENMDAIALTDLEDKYVWTLEADGDNWKIKNGTQYVTWTSGNSANLGATAKSLTFEVEDNQVQAHFNDGTNERYLSLNATTNNNYFAFYSGTNQITNLFFLPYQEETPEPQPETDNYVVLARRDTKSNWFYMTSDLGTASNKRYQAVDAGTTSLANVNTSNLDSKYYWQIEDSKLHTAAGYSTWTSGNTALLDETGKELNIEQQTDGTYTFSFADGTNTRYLALNKTVGNNYFAYYSGTNQINRLTLVKEGESGTTTAIEEIKSQQELQSATKVLRDGQIFILRGDKTYTVTGQEVK